MTAAPLACQEVAARVATSDRAATADLILDVAVKAAVARLRATHVGTPAYRAARAELILAPAAETAERLIGGRDE